MKQHGHLRLGALSTLWHIHQSLTCLFGTFNALPRDVVAVGAFFNAGGAPVTFGDVVVANPSGRTAGMYNSFASLVWKLNSEGTTLWVMRGGMLTGTSDSTARLASVSVSDAGRVVVRSPGGV